MGLKHPASASVPLDVSPRSSGTCLEDEVERRLRGAAEPREPGCLDDLTDPGRRARGFESARTRLAHGERLRRTRNRKLAREQLRTAADAFELLGARPWAD